MTIRKIEKNDLPIIAKLANQTSLESREDICFDHSRICLSDKGEVLCFIILREHSLIDFFNGEIPADENTEYDEDYVEGDEWWVKEHLVHFEKHYEVIAMYNKEGEGSPSFNNTIVSIENKNVILWTIQVQPEFSHFYNLNDTVWVDIPYIIGY